jgi:hypothetical protein
MYDTPRHNRDSIRAKYLKREIIFMKPPHYVPVFDSASNKNEYQEYS